MTSVEGGGSSRRGMVAALLNPPSVALVLLEKKKDEFGKRSKVTLTSTPPFTPCSLCHDGQPEEDVLGSQEDDLLLVTTEALRTMMTQVGLVLEEDLTFCSFCLAQVQNLLRFKREMDRMGERFVTMVTGLQDLLLPRVNGLNDLDNSGKEKQSLNKVMEMTRRFPCGDCPQLFLTRSDLCLHSMTHKKKKRGVGRPKKSPSSRDPPGPIKKKRCYRKPFPCRDCPRAFDNRASLNLHTLSTHTGQSLSYPCPKCPRRFGNKYNLEKHLPRHLPQAERPFPCPTCPWRCGSQPDLESHIRQSHKKKRTLLSSGTLNFLTKTQKAKVDNKKKKEGVVDGKGNAMEKPYTCNLCPLRFERQGHLLRHSQTHLPKNQRTFFECEICSRKFTREDTRNHHMAATHHHHALGEMNSVEAHLKPTTLT